MAEDRMIPLSVLRDLPTFLVLVQPSEGFTSEHGWKAEPVLYKAVRLDEIEAFVEAQETRGGTS